ncbi:MAG: hemerythrin domain-containing protein [Rhodocyclaceae bacterium]|nr:MAG: hemerythrin domain-containing protein [Rhodocyclaceae bacterium]
MSREVTRIIRQEHTDISAVLYVFREALQRLATTGGDFDLLQAILDYIATYPWRWHHPKEDLLIDALRQLADLADRPMLDRLAGEHQQGDEKVGALVALFAPAGRDPEATRRFVEAGEDFITDEWAHMKAEEEQLLPRLEQALDEATWARLATQLEAFDHPRFGIRPADDARRLFAHILNLALRTTGDANNISTLPKAPRKDH